MKIGILGGGQLGRMLALSAHALGLRTAIVDPAAESAAGQVAPVLRAAWDDARARELLASCDVVTYEFENVPDDVVASLAGSVAVHPAPVALAATSDRLHEKQLFASHGLATPRFRAVDSAADLERAVDELGLPAVVKTRRFGYDGKGQRVLRVDSDVAGAWRALGPQPLLLEEWIDFDREVSLLAVRGRDGQVRFWEPTENTHVDGILRVSRAPAPGVGEEALRAVAARCEALLARLDYVGVAAFELFARGDRWIANEAACRVHNSGHWTIEGAVTSQFENHLRAVAGLPLGSTASRGPVAMVNLIGVLPDAESVLALAGAHLHRYGKTPAPGRKLGHVTISAATPAEVDARLRELVHRLGDAQLAAALERIDASGSGDRRAA